MGLPATTAHVMVTCGYLCPTGHCCSEVVDHYEDNDGWVTHWKLRCATPECAALFIAKV